MALFLVSGAAIVARRAALFQYVAKIGNNFARKKYFQRTPRFSSRNPPDSRKPRPIFTPVRHIPGVVSGLFRLFFSLFAPPPLFAPLLSFRFAP
ncbi:MAG: hypothetical protein K2L06_01160, partial [Alistipes sp.]|nr:hypothetical protein [Alistipes sp.]